MSQSAYEQVAQVINQYANKLYNNEERSELEDLFRISKRRTEAYIKIAGQIYQGIIDLTETEQESLKDLLNERYSQLVPTINRFVVNVDYSLPVEQMIGEDDYYSSYGFTSKRFPPVEGSKKEIEVFLVSFNRGIGGRDVLIELDRLGYVPAGLWELLALGPMLPKTLVSQRRIVAYATTWKDSNGDLCVPAMIWKNDRSLGGFLRSNLIYWDTYTAFIALKK